MLTKLAPLLLLLPFAPSAHAQLLVPTSQERQIDVYVQIFQNSPITASESAVGFGSFDEAVVAMDSGSQGVSAFAASAQTSVITSNGISATGNYNVESTQFPSIAYVTNSCNVQFQITQNAQYTLSGFVEAFDIGSTVVFLVGDTGFQFQGLARDFDEDTSFNQSGVLTPGSYELTILSESEVSDGFPVALGSGAYAFDLQLSPVVSGDCVPTANSTGGPAVLYTGGAPATGGLGFGVGVEGAPPGQTGLFIYGGQQPATPFGDGVLCVGQPLVRFPSVVLIQPGGTAGNFLNFNGRPFSGGGPGTILPGSTWTFQFWFRDAPSQNGWNTSSAATVLFEL